MELLVRVRWRHVPAADLRLEVEAYHRVGDLLSAASEFCDGNWDASQPMFLERTGEQIALDLPIIESGIVSGDTLRFELYGVDTLDRESLSEAVSCDVTAGPEAGRSFVLLPGRHEVGRGSGLSVRLDDVTVSDHQLSIIVYDDLVTRVVPDPSATNPVVVNGHPVAEATVVGPNDVVQFGATAVALRVFSRSSDSERDQLGQVPFRRTPYKPVIVQERAFKPLGNIPSKPEPRRFSMITTILPLVAGLTMFALFRSPMFLVMTLLSPLSMAGQWWDSRKSGTRKFADSIDKFGRRLEKRKAEVEQALLDERAERIHQSPDLADLARRATLRTLDLWARQRRDDEFLRTRLGIGTVASKITVEPESGGEEYLREATAVTVTGCDRVPACPICVNLAELGVFGLHGELTDVRAMCSSIILQAVTLHSPEDLVLVVIEGVPQGLGAWAKWLPHTRSATSPISARHVVEDEAAAAEMVRELVSVARLRTSSDDRSDHRWPWILVVLDESANVDAALASQLLDLCPHAGISVVAAVEVDARVPRQAKATMGCVPQIGGTLALSTVWFTDPEVAPEHLELEPANARLIDQVAMSLAPLRDATAASATAAIPRLVPLFSLFGPELPTPLSIATEWARPKPYGLRASDRHRTVGSPRTRPRRARPACPDRRHVRSRQERTAAVDRRRADPRVSADPPDVPVRRLQGRGGERRLQRRPAHRRVRHQPRGVAVVAGTDVAEGGTEPPDAVDGGQGQGPCRDDRALPGRGTSVTRHRRRRVRHARQGGPRLRGRRRRHRPARPQPRCPLDPGHATPVGLGQRQHLGQHQPAHLTAHARQHRVQDDHRRRLGGRHPAAAQGSWLRQARTPGSHRVPVGVHRCPTDPGGPGHPRDRRAVREHGPGGWHDDDRRQPHDTRGAAQDDGRHDARPDPDLQRPVDG